MPNHYQTLLSVVAKLSHEDATAFGEYLPKIFEPMSETTSIVFPQEDGDFLSLSAKDNRLLVKTSTTECLLNETDTAKALKLAKSYQ